DARPEALRRFELMVEEVARNASAVAQNTAEAKKSASDASTSAREAATHATDAAGSARAASTSAGQAATSAQSASSSAGTASAKATEASKSAAAAESSKSAAATSAGAAKTSETNAAASQKSAATSASTATTKASEAATSARDAAASKEAAKSSETNASSSASSAASSATAAGNSAKAAKTSETNADNSAQAAAASQTASANSATAAKKSETNAKNSEAAAKSSETNAKASETNAKSSETNAAKSAADALNYRNQAQVIVGDNIGLGSAPRDCPDISGNPSGYIGFMRIMSNAKGFPSIASGESSLTGFISQVDGTPAYTGVFQGWATRSLYTYRWNPTIGPQWTRHARKDEVDRLTQLTGNTRVYCQNASKFFSIYDSGTWGYYDAENSEWIPLSIAVGGTGAATIDGARTNLGLGRSNSPQLNSLFLDRYSDSTNTYTSSGILHTRLLATDSTVRLGADMYVETLSNEPGQLTIRFTYDGSTGASKYLNINSEGNLIVDSAILKSTVEKPLQIRSANPAIRFNETDRPANTPTYTLIANGGNWFIHKSDYDDAGSTSTAISYNFANDRLDVKNLKASGHITCETINQSSDRDLKDNIQVIGDATEAIRKMNGYTYTLKENGLPYAGVIAQEVMEALPEAVGSFTHYGEALQGPTVDGNELREETRDLNVDYAAVTGLLVQVARETDDRVTALEEENTTLRENLATADTRISTLENQVSELVALVRQLTGSEH
ncbi:TPA: tail fiber domain-containing protein, partial [Escherichia coli]